jgi:membrane-associated phospholipid phosphatase
VQRITDIIIRIMADGLVVPIVLIAAWRMLLIPRQQWLERIGRGIFAGLVALWFSKIMSLFYQEGERPFVALGVNAKAAYLNNPGFPSDHVLFVFCITFVVWASTKNKLWSSVLFVLSALVAIGRVVALVHTPADVVGGLFAALAAVSIVYGRDFYRAALKK